jgi:hypothetical protein
VLYYSGIKEGVGIAGPSSIEIGTTTMYSCIGIVFVTRNYRFGGLYHYPACTIFTAPVQATIIQMLNDIGPSDIVLTPAGGDGNRLQVTIPSDLDDVKTFLKVVWPGVTVYLAPAARAAYLRWQNGIPQFNRGAPADGQYRRAPARVRNAFNPSGRELEAGIWYYGG